MKTTKLNETPVRSELEKFDLAFQEIVKFSESGFLKGDQEVSDRFVNLLNYNLTGGKKNRGQYVVRCFQELVPACTEEQLEKARILGWCIELFQSYFLIHDDIMDGSITRRGQPCWYRLGNVGLVAINDANYLQSLNFKILKHYFGNSKAYMELVELFLDMYHNTIVGQCFDLISNPPGSTTINFDSYTEERYKKIIVYKTAYYTFCLPIRCALYLAGIKDAETHRKVEEIMLMIGQLFQIQDDFLDLHGNPKVTGKVGTDIIEGKCSWFIVNALNLANEEQLAVIKKHYGQNNPGSVEKIRRLFEELRLKQQFHNLEENSYRELNQLINGLAKSTRLPESAFSFTLNSIYKRVK